MRIWLAVGRTDMRRGMQGLALQVQETLGRDPHLCVGRDYVAELRRCPPSLPSLESSAT
ncbi:IS66 family insertion sequence element accessory protein TnpB [Mesorhizobium sp. M1163]|uniref:IS66 family insertion sequence element accessory protein TnpB n=1 Tax=Mesorhizobium sp. M1163 TaxID=2957065 RepID=UPI00333B3F8A